MSRPFEDSNKSFPTWEVQVHSDLLYWGEYIPDIEKKGGLRWENTRYFCCSKSFFKTISTRDIKKACELAYLTYLR